MPWNKFNCRWQRIMYVMYIWRSFWYLQRLWIDHNICKALYISKIIIVLHYTHCSATYDVRGTQVYRALHPERTMPRETDECTYQCFLRRIGCWILSVRGWMWDHCPLWYKLPSFHLRFHRPVWETTLISSSSSLSGAREPIGSQRSISF